MSPADCTATAPDAVVVREAAPPLIGWPSVVGARPDLDAMRLELEDSFAAYMVAQKAQDTIPIPMPEEGSPLDVAYQEAMNRHIAAVRAWTKLEAATPAELVAKAEAMMSTAGDPEGLDDSTISALCADVVRIVRSSAAPQVDPARVRWGEAFGRWNAALAAVNAAESIVYAIEDTIAGEVPPPEELRRRPSDGPDAFYVDVDQIWSNETLTASEKVRLSGILLELIDKLAAAGERHGEHAAEEELRRAAKAYRKAGDALLRSEAPDIAAVLVKLRIREVRMNDTVTRYEDLDCPEKLAELLTSSAVEDWSFGHVFQDLLRLTQPSSPPVDVVPFDAAAWAAEYESHPNCTVTQYGCAYHDDDYDKSFTVDDPDLIAAFVRGRAQTEPYFAHPGRARQAFIMGNRSMIAEVYASLPEQAAALERLWDERAAERHVGVDMVAQLTPWQRKAVQDFARQRLATAA
ncbi:hypothetical protein [Caulobacter sp. S45]|uniref:hypothetical protein n=1 Tax=Caulobacter sp. S45 TaxID=1641861 RepID=UPI001576E1F7|nr:hypothetical protein [Caulobacter sp. S45]